MRREALVEVDGFDASLIAGEEPELCQRLRARGYQILHVDRPMTGHDLAMTHWRQYWRRAVRAGHAYAEVAARFRGTAVGLINVGGGGLGNMLAPAFALGVFTLFPGDDSWRWRFAPRSRWAGKAAIR